MKQELVNKLLKGLGFTDELLKKAETDDFNADDAIEAINNSQKEHYEGLLKNELTATIKDDIIKSRDGEMLKILNHNLKKQGIPVKEIEELPIAEKIMKFTDFIKNKYEKQGTDDASKQFKVIEEENLSLKNKLTEIEEFWKAENEKVVQSAQGQLIKDKVDLRLQKEFNNIPDNRLIGGKKNEGFYLAVKNMIETKYDTNIDEKGNTVFYEKGTQKRVTTKRDGKEDFLTPDDVLKNELKSLSLWVESNGQAAARQTTATTSGTATKSARLQEMERAAEAA